MSTISIHIKNITQIKAAFDKAPALMTRELSRAIKKTVFNIQEKSMKNTPVLTGNLRGSHRSKFEPLKGEVGTHTNYDVYVHDGTKFMKARPYLADAVNQTERDTDTFFTQAVDNVLNEIGRAV